MCIRDRLDRQPALAARLAEVLDRRRKANASPTEVRALAAELAHLHADGLNDRPGAEQAWLAVLDASPDDAEGFDELAALYRDASRWTDLRGLLERRVT